MADGIREPRKFLAQPAGDGVFRVKLTPVSREPDQKVDLDVHFPNGRAVKVQVTDSVVKVGEAKFLLSDLNVLVGGPSPRAFPRRGAVAMGPILGLGKVKMKSGTKTITVDLNEASQINVQPLNPPPPVEAVEARIEVKQGSTVLATVTKRAELGGAPVQRKVAVRVGRDIVIVPVRPTGPPVRTSQQGPSDEGLIKIGGVLDISGERHGAGKAICPPTVPIPEAKFGESASSEGEIRPFVGNTGNVWCVAVSPDGQRALTAGHDRLVRLWDLQSCTQLKEFPGHTDHVKGVAFLPDGRRHDFRRR